MTELTLRWLRVVLPLLLFAFPPTLIEGQVVRGRLVDDQSGDPIPTANVKLLRGTQGGEVISSFITDEFGEFLLASIGDGRVRLRADRIGYKEVTSPPFDLVRPDTLDVELRMAVEAVPLAPLTVVSERGPLLLTRRYEIGGFLERKETYGREGLGMGTFLVREDWEHRSPILMVDLLREVSGLRISGSEVRMRITGFDPRGCRPEWYLDGHHIRFRGETMDDLISPASVAAVEVYPGLSKPAQFMDMGSSPCGAIVIWSG